MDVNEVFQEGDIINNKNKMKYLLAFIITLFAYSVNAQTVGSVSGRVTDDEGNAIGRAGAEPALCARQGKNKQPADGQSVWQDGADTDSERRGG